MGLSYIFRKSAFDNLQHWEITEQGLLCTDTKTEQKKLIPYDFIQSIRIQAQPYRDFRYNNFRCRITTTNGEIIDVLSTSYVGFADFSDEAATYTPFVRALVKTTKNINPNSVIYLGQTSSTYNGNQTLVLIAIALALVLIFSFPMGQSRLLALLLIIIGAWQYLRISKTVHQPQTLQDDKIPDYVLPATKTGEGKTGKHIEKKQSE